MKEQIEGTAREFCHLSGKYETCQICAERYHADGELCYFKCMANEIIHHGYRKQEWISVADRLPDVLDDYLVVVKLKYEWETEWEYHTDVAGLVLENGYIDGVWDTLHDWNEGQECHVTHWMPIPEPPKMKGGAE